MAGEAAAQFHLLDLAGSRRESARLTQTPQYLVIVLSDGWSFGGRDLGSDAGGYKQRVVVAGCYTKGAGLVAHHSNFRMLRCTRKIRPAESSTKWRCGQPSRELRVSARRPFSSSNRILGPFRDTRHR